jgi:hypothetical protein
MNPWKPIALVSMAVCVMSIGHSVASAAPGGARPMVQLAQPHMEAALSSLQHAQTELSSAEHDKGGWRADAVAGVTKAIAQTQKGIAAGNAR